MTIQSYPGQILPELWISGYQITQDATTPNTVLNIGAGICRDSNNVIDMCLGASNQNFVNQTVQAPLILNAAYVGVNALDTGSLQASTVYAIYIIGDSTYQHPTASLLSASSKALPAMPNGYDSWRLIGYIPTDASANFFKVNYSGTSNTRTVFLQLAPLLQESSTYHDFPGVTLSLAKYVPAINNTIVDVYMISDFAADTTGYAGIYNGADPSLSTDTGGIYIQPSNGTGNASTIQYVFGGGRILSQLVAGVPSIQYVFNDGVSGSQLTINLRSFDYTI